MKFIKWFEWILIHLFVWFILLSILIHTQMILTYLRSSRNKWEETGINAFQFYKGKCDDMYYYDSKYARILNTEFKINAIKHNRF